MIEKTQEKTQEGIPPKDMLLNEIDRVAKETKKRKNERVAFMKDWIEDMHERMGGSDKTGVSVNGEWASMWALGFQRSRSHHHWLTNRSSMFGLNENGYVEFTTEANKALYFLLCDDKGVELVESEYEKSEPFLPSEENVRRLLSDLRLWEVEEQEQEQEPFQQWRLPRWILPLCLLIALGIITFFLLRGSVSSPPSSDVVEVVMQGFPIEKTTESKLMEFGGLLAKFTSGIFLFVFVVKGFWSSITLTTSGDGGILASLLLLLTAVFFGVGGHLLLNQAYTDHDPVLKTSQVYFVEMWCEEDGSHCDATLVDPAENTFIRRVEHISVEDFSVSPKHVTCAVLNEYVSNKTTHTYMDVVDSGVCTSAIDQ